MNGQHNLISATRCPNPRCDRLNRPDARFCGRCGTRLTTVPLQTVTPTDSPPHIGFVLIFLAFFLVIFLAVAGIAGGGTWLVLAIAGFGMVCGAGRGNHRRRARHT